MKTGLILDNVPLALALGMKGDLFMKVAVQRGARVPLACWWGNGLPRLRWLAGLRDDQPHWNWNTVQTPTGGSSEEFCAMGETLTQQRRVSDEDFRIVKLCQAGKNASGQ